MSRLDEKPGWMRRTNEISQVWDVMKVSKDELYLY